MAVVLLWTGCANDGMNEPSQGDPFTLSICLPADEVNAARMCSPRRVMGDPGMMELFELPRYIYIIVMKKALGDPDWSFWETMELRPREDEWTKKRYGGGLVTAGDSIYQYNIELRRLLATPRFDGRVYIIASAVGLTFNKALNDTYLNSQSAVESLKFASMAPADKDDSIQANLQHIYSTPCNYMHAGDYYGAFKKEQRVPHLDMVLYHVAAKVDITWNVVDSMRIRANKAEAVRLTHMKACNLFNDSAYCFKPMANRAASKLTTNDTITIVTKDDEGLWWEGRSYFYTIPYTTTGKPGYFPLQMELGTNDSTKYYKPTINLNIENDTTFVPWLRATFNITQPLTAGSKDIDA